MAFLKHGLFSGMALAASLACFQASAQQTDSIFSDMDIVVQKDARITGINPAGLQYLSVKKISTAALQFNKSDGGFRNYYMSDNSFSWGASTEAYQRLQPRTVLYGKIAYNNFTGKNMGGSAFIDPYKNPFNIVENADTTAGTKKLEQYTLTGAVSTALSSRLNIGAKLDFNAANYAKTKDLRHTNKLLDMQTSAGFQYNISRRIQAGLAYRYTRRIESVIFKIYGNTDRQYLSLIDFGAFYGRVELFTDAVGTTYTDASNNMPLVNNTHTGSLQLTVQLTPSLRWHNEFSYSSRKGHYGKKGTSYAVLTEHDAEAYEYSGTLSFAQNNDLHNLQVKTSFETLHNYENIFNRVTNSSGASSIVYYGQNEMLLQYNTTVGMVYTFNKNIDHNNPAWVFGAFANYLNRDMTTTLYPYYRNQDINSYTAGLSAGKNITRQKKMYGISLGIAYGSGSGAAKNDAVYAPPASSQQPPRSRDTYLYQEYEYLTSSRIHINPAVQLDIPVYTGINGYVKLGYAFTKAFNTTYLSSTYGSLNLAIGCNF
ncbi:MAG: hypothetical protein QM687_07725 [Ferruginibacter sp.]